MKYFIIEEIVDPVTYKTFGNECWNFFPDESLEMLDSFREFIGAPVTCNNWHKGEQFQFRGFRPAWCDVGAKGSPHKKGMGFDVDVRDMTPEEVRQKVMADQDNPLLKHIKRIEGLVNWFHFDRFEPPQGKNRIYVFHP